MSTAAPPPAPPRATAAHRQFVDEQIERTRRSLRWTDFATSAIGLLTALLIFLLAAAILDHWVFRGGLSVPLRGGLFAVLVAGGAWYGWRTLAPLLRPINPAYAAQTIERHAPSLKNSLLNLLMFRSGRQRMSPKVYDAIEQQAAERLALSDVDDAVDKSAALHKGYLLLGAAVLCALYAVLSPKNLATSASRVMLPWAEIAAPSRVQILDVVPGDGETARGDVVKISATVTGARADEPVTLHYRSIADDGAASAPEQSLELHATGEPDAVGRWQFDGQLPPPGARGASLGLQEPLEYWIEAGDGRTRRYHIDLFSKPTIVVQQVRYEPPAYTGLPTTEAVNTGDIGGLEGTQVTISALANRPIRAAHIDFDADGTRDIEMKLDGDRATGTFKLALRDDRRTPRHKSYVLRFTGEDDRSNEDPARYHIEVTADYPPTVEITAPTDAVKTVAVNEAVPISVVARDLDFALSSVRLEGEVDGQRIELGRLLETRHEGRFQGSLSFTPAEARLKPGQVLEYWAVAQDNRTPRANDTQSDRQRLRIASPEEAPANGQRQPGDQPQNDNPEQGGNKNDANDAQQDSGESGEGNGAGGGENGAEGEANDQQGEGGQGGAGGEQQGEQDGGENQQGDGQQGDGLPGGGENGGGGEQSDQNQAAGGQSGQGAEGNEESENAGGGGNAAEPSEGQPGGDQPNDGQSSGNQPHNGNQAEGGKPGDNQDNGGGEPGGEPGGEASQEPVSSNGDDDATAFQRMAEHFAKQNQDNQSGDQNAGGEAGESPQAGNEAQPQGDEGQAGQQPPGGDQSANGQDASNNQQPGANGESPEGGNTGDAAAQPNEAGDAGNGLPPEANDAGANAGENMNGEQPGAPQDGSSTSPPGGSGDEQFAEKNPDGGEPGDDSGEQQGANPSDVTNPNQGAGGSGSQGDDPQATPDAGQQPHQGDKNDRDPEGADPQSDEAPSGGQSKQESDSSGGQSGDQSGGGSKGAGQRADSEGEGAPGENTAADEGAGAAEQPGEGETGSKPGGDQLAEGQTGESSGDQPGAGSESRDSGSAGDATAQPNDVGDAGAGDQPEGADPNAQPPGAQPGQQPGQQPGGAGQQGAQDAAGENRPPEQSNDNPAAGAPTDGGGGTAGGANAGAGPEAEGLGADEANLDFAQKQTDLILNRLDEQLAKHKVDQDLLKKLGWSADDLRKFVDRWKSLKEQAKAPGQEGVDAAVELDEALKSLGLRRDGPQRYNATAKADELRELTDAYRARAPREYQDRVRAYVRGAAAADAGDEGQSP
ncbi:MAG: hypothetical protein KDA44_09675 [Planctomycetales bacterium]|nr:hypothetical protein [Planctomycetales bacterium]